MLILSVAYDERERAVLTFVPRTTSVRGTRFEVPHAARGFDAGAFDAQGLAGVPAVQLIRRLGVIDGVRRSPKSRPRSKAGSACPERARADRCGREMLLPLAKNATFLPCPPRSPSTPTRAPARVRAGRKPHLGFFPRR